MYVGVCRLTLVAPGTRSLKEKRSWLRRIKDRTASKFRVSVAEVDLQDVWQKAVIGYAVVSGSRPVAESLLDSILGFIESMGVAQIIGDDREVFRFEDGDFGAVDEWVSGKYE
jgi:uncharacterized protein YlxP (DUF503 family)